MTNEFTLKPLPFEYDALEPVIDKATVTIHHDKHQQTYVDNLNNAVKKHPDLFNYSLGELLKNLDKVPDDINAAVINNAGGVYNHEFYWEGLKSPSKEEPTGSLRIAIEKAFGSFEGFKKEFKDAGLTQFGSGWAWLILDETNSLKIIKTPNQNCPLSTDEVPLLTVDVWEHAYYLKYQNKRAEYLDNFFDIINWNIVSERFDLATRL